MVEAPGVFLDPRSLPIRMTSPRVFDKISDMKGAARLRHGRRHTKKLFARLTPAGGGRKPDGAQSAISSARSTRKASPGAASIGPTSLERLFGSAMRDDMIAFCLRDGKRSEGALPRPARRRQALHGRRRRQKLRRAVRRIAGRAPRAFRSGLPQDASDHLSAATPCRSR